MGKVNRKKLKNDSFPKSEPLQSKSKRDDDQQSYIFSEHKVINEITNQLKDASVDVKECGINRLQNLLSDHCNPNELVINITLHTNMVKTVAPFMTNDMKNAINLEAIGIMKNMALVSDETCQRLIEQDVMTCIIAAFKKWNLSPSELTIEEGENKHTMVLQLKILNLLTQLLTILVSGCEKAFKIFNMNTMLSDHIWPLFEVTSKINSSQCKTPEIFVVIEEIVISTLNCLLCVSEENESVTTFLASNSDVFQSKMEEIASGSKECCCSPEDLHSAVLMTGIVINTIDSLKLEADPNLCNLVWSVLIKAINFEDGLSFVTSNANNEMNDDNKEKETVIDLKDLQLVLKMKKVALELLTNLCCDDDHNTNNDHTEENDYSMNDDDDPEMLMRHKSLNDEEDDGETVDEMNELLNKKSQLSLPNSLNITDFISSLTNKCIFNDETLKHVEKQNDSSETTRQLITNRVQALTCLTNISQNIELDDKIGTDLILKFSNFLKNERNSNRENILEAVTALLVALTSKKMSKAVSVDIDVSIFNGDSLNDDSTINLVNFAGNLVTKILPESENNSCCLKLIKFVISMLTDALRHDDSPNVVMLTECLNVIFDIFGRDLTEMDKIAIDIGLIYKMKSSLSVIKKLSNAQNRAKNLCHDSLQSLLDAKSNCIRFIKYLENERNL